MSEKRDLGWLNSWFGKTEPAEYAEYNDIRQKCHDLKHKVNDIDVGPPNRGVEHVVTCEICGYVYRYDSSD